MPARPGSGMVYKAEELYLIATFSKASDSCLNWPTERGSICFRFVVELCEPVQVQSIEMGNLELFSSVPESFLVQVSDR